MTQKQRLLTVLMTLLLSVTGAWALDGSGTNSDPYQLGSLQDWKDFAAITNADATGAGAWAVMTADIDLGTDQTNICPTWNGEFSDKHYHGTFDGQGHTLTVHYNSSNMFHTPFSQTSGATIKNLHVAGTIKSTSSDASHMSGLVSNSAGHDVIENVWVSADITGGSNSWIECGAFVGCNNCGNTTITDCLFTGSITTTGGNNGCFAGWVQSYSPSSVTTTNCLSTGTFNFSSGEVSRGTINNSYVKSYPNSIPASMQTDATNLSGGTTTTALNNGRKNGPWVQDAVSGEPRLDLFMATTSLTANEGKTGEYWSTYYDGAKSSIADANTTVYTGKVNGDKIDLTEIVDKTIPAGNAVILKSTAANVTLTKTSATGTLANNDLKGVDVATAKTNVYCLSKNGTVVGFYKFKGDVPAHRAYIESPLSAPMLGLDDGETTSLSEELRVKSEEPATAADAVWYTLDGRQLNAQPSRKGIYVRNRKKFIVK